ncbi:MAG: serine/threonine-protein kinase, partial [Pseudomonadota bacterium]
MSTNQQTAVFQSGTRLGAYEIGARLGLGATGVVYDAVRITDGKRVAIKVLNAELAAKPTARARFLNEAKLAARLRHPNIVEIVDAGEEGERAYLVMELLEGEDLAVRLQRSGAMSIAEAVDVLVPVCDAVATAHRLGITHRDLKPSNIFLSVRDGRVRPVVLDFGVAKDHEPGGAAEIQVPQGVFGTPMYLAPELVADQGAAGPASDQYALGVILHEAL